MSETSVLCRPDVVWPAYPVWPGANLGARRAREALVALAERAVLRSAPWFADIPLAVRQEFERHCEVRSVRAGAAVEGFGAPGLYGIVSGALAVRLHRPGAQVLDYLSAGTWWLDTSVLAGGAPLLQLEGQGRTKVAVLPPEVLRELLRRHPAAAPSLHALAQAGMRRVAPILEDLASLPLRARLARCVLRLCDSFGRAEAEGTRIALALSQDEIAQMLRASRQSVNSQLKALCWKAPRPDHSGLMLAVLATAPQCAMSLLMRLARAGASASPGSRPSAFMRSTVSLSLRISATVERSLARMGSGVPLGAMSAVQIGTSKPATPDSAMVGTSGRAAERLPVVTASALSLPPLTLAITAGLSNTPTWISAPSRPDTTGPEPL